MKPKGHSRDAFELLQAHFDPLLDPDHELILPANKVDGRIWMRPLPRAITLTSVLPGTAGANLRKLPGLLRRKAGSFLLR